MENVYTEFALLLLASAGAGFLALRMRQPLLIAYIAAGKMARKNGTGRYCPGRRYLLDNDLFRKIDGQPATLRAICSTRNLLRKSAKLIVTTDRTSLEIYGSIPDS